MFKELIEAFKKSDPLASMIEQFGEMLDAGQWMFKTACSVMAKRTDAESVREELYTRDRKINRLEYSIRRQLVAHLAMGHREDVSMCLLLMSVVKDAERIGDYCKNLFEIGKYFQREYTRPEYTTPLNDVESIIGEIFPLVEEAFRNGDYKAANQLVEKLSKSRGQCDTLIRQLLAPGSTGPQDEAVAYALRARFFKRVASHLGNIATSVNNPVPMIDFSQKKPFDEPEG